MRVLIGSVRKLIRGGTGSLPASVKNLEISLLSHWRTSRQWHPLISGFRVFRRSLTIIVGAIVCSLLGSSAQAGIPTEFKLSPVIEKLLTDSVTTQEERRTLALFHGQWDRLDHPTAAETAAIAWQRYDLTHDSLSDASTDVLIRAQAALARGQADIAIRWLQDEHSIEADLLRARALEMNGSIRDAVATLAPWRDQLRNDPLTDAAELTAAAQVIERLARLEGRPAQDYTLAMSLLAKARDEFDPLYWPAYLAEARILADKDNLPQAGEALMQTLTLNPRCAQAWFLLGQLATNSYDFDAAGRCVAKLRQVNKTHLLADLLEAQILLTQKDPAGARAIIEPALGRFPQQRQLLALLGAVEALSFNEPALKAVLAHYDTLSPQSPLALYAAGRYFAKARQYAKGQAMLRRAIERAGNWPKPRIELGLLLMQAGDEDAAQTELRHAVRLDPFNRRAANQLKLLDELDSYQEIRTPHFVIRYPPGIDEVLARDMPDTLERIYQHATGVYGYRPTNPTIIEILPDEKRFGVRMTGIPDIWTIAACTGDVIALTPPRGGVDQNGPYDWVNVLQHEFVHTVTLNQTDYRIPHWFTEGTAVTQEITGRSYQDCMLLALALRADKLFSLSDINWAFIRPKTPRDRPLAYAQASWMIQYITATFGHGAVRQMLGRFSHGDTAQDAIAHVTGQDEYPFMEGFKAWGRLQIRQWGLAPQPTDPRVEKVLADSTNSSQDLDQLLEEYPRHPDLLLIAARRALEHLEDEGLNAARQAVSRYAAARPVDPWSDKQLAMLAIRAGRPDEAIAHLEQLDRQETQSGQWAHQLTLAHRKAGRLSLAADAIGRALQREPYNPAYRELAATIELQQNHLETALHHLNAMPLLEPDRAIHHIRLAAMHAKMGDAEKAKAAAEKARAIDPNAPVDKYLSP